MIAHLGTSADNGGESDCACHGDQPPQLVGRHSGLFDWLMISGAHITGVGYGARTKEFNTCGCRRVLRNRKAQ